MIDLQYLSKKEQKDVQGEIEFLKVLKGPTFIKFHENFRYKNKVCIVMEYASKGNLGELIEMKIAEKVKNPYAAFPTKVIMRYLSQLCLAMLYMNKKYILHRDIKTANIFIHQNGILKLGDFGISRQLNSSNHKVNTAAGTPYFMAPEVLATEPYDSKADMWSLGVIIYELITLNKPFDAPSV